MVRRVLDRAKHPELFPVWRYHPFFTNSTEPTTEADITHRRHAICETVCSDLIDGPMAHLPPALPGQQRLDLCAMITHNLLRAAGTLTRGTRRRAAAPPAPADRGRPRPAGPTPTPPRAAPTRALALRPRWLRIWTAVFGHALGPPATA